ncbi:MAG: alanine--tRNA ligase [Thermoguttaceae bacterium]|nr:alanine--tRNA ligase [Thermoguttaceae bacterium]MDW8036585.1 alanine--tRNA ligase [Thermoguttaceae bacterium]
MKTDELREAYLSFFETKGCVRRPSDVLVPRGDPTVLFTPAGMNQFKDEFLGRKKPEFTRVTTCQKCLRTGDIDKVGRTAYHHTFFEMLGNFSFGDYFKREAIHWAWEFLTSKKWLGLDPDRFSATVYLDDDEAYDIWHKEIGLPAERLARMDEDENFWPASAPSQGPDGVCGPCSEIYCHTPFGKVEIWNLVFTQFNRVGPPPNNLRPLPKKNIDTGMGLERMASVLQGVESNFHIDILRPIVEAAADVCHVRYEPTTEDGCRLRRIADHIRACTFAIHENVYPSNEKQGYVVRRLLRRAMLDGYQIGVREPFLYRLVPVVVELMRQPYPELMETAQRVADGIRYEESQFLQVIEEGLPRAERLLEELAAAGHRMVPGKAAFDLLQTHGFPPELLENLASDRAMEFDWDGFRQAKEAHEKVSGAGQRLGPFVSGPLDVLKKSYSGSEFVGYESLVVEEATVIGLLVGGQLCYELTDIDAKQPAALILDKTPFYGEMGGQVGDTGQISWPGGRFEVVDTQIDSGFTLHVGYLRQGKVGYKDKVRAEVDAPRRAAIRRAHTATHLLHYALRKHLGPQTQQRGSKVEPDVLRFDFNYPKALEPEQLTAIEREVNQLVLAAEPVRWELMPKQQAQKIGAIMLFGEKYPDIVRVVTAGQFSKELCGGTHLDNTAQVGLFKIVGEESISAGTRRITALTGMGAWEHIHHMESLLGQTALLLRTSPSEVPMRVQALLQENKQLRKQATTPKQELVRVTELIEQATELADGRRVITAEVPGADAALLRNLIDQIRRKISSVAVMLGTKQDGEKVLLVAGASRDLVEQGFDCVQWVRQVAPILQGGGGGRPDLAQAGGKLPDKLAEALQAAQQFFTQTKPN